MVEITSGHNLTGLGSIPWEIGNAFSLMLKQKRLSLEDAQEGLAIFQSVPVRYVTVDLEHAISIAHANNLYAYDAYFLDCATRNAASS